jgi:hypothetical protein
MKLRTLILTFSVCLCAAACSHTVAVHDADAPKPLPSPPLVGSAPAAPAESVYHPIPKKEILPSAAPPKEPELAQKQPEPPSKPDLVLAAAPPVAIPVKDTLNSTGPAPKPSQTVDAPTPPPESPLLTALRAYLNGQPADALALLKRYDQATQEILICLLPLIARTSQNGLQAGTREYSNVHDELMRLGERLGPHADLKIEKMCFCINYQSFGVYVPIPVESPRFQVGQRVKLYVELKNFTSEWRDNAYMIYHRSTLAFLGFDGKPVTFNYRGRIASALPIDEERPDKSRSPRHDFAYHYDFQIPHMPPGFYTLVLRVTDVPTGRSAERTLDFQVKHPE